MEAKGRCPETIKAVGPFALNMPVVKLNNGDVLLYCPVRVSSQGGRGRLAFFLTLVTKVL